MNRSIRSSALFAVFVAVAIGAAATLVLLGSSTSGANNPPTTLLGTVAVDPTDNVGSPTPTPVWTIAEENGRYYICLLYTSPSPRDS